MIVSSEVCKILKAVEELQERDSVENMIKDLDRLFDAMALSEEFSGYDRQRRAHLLGTYRNLQKFLSQLPPKNL